MELLNDSLVVMSKEEYTQLSMDIYQQYNTEVRTVLKEQVNKSFRTGYYTGIELGILIVLLGWILVKRIKQYRIHG